jgi:hypothetical protein
MNNTLYIKRIKSFLKKTFVNIDMADVANKKDEDKERIFYSRALAAFSIVTEGYISIEEAEISITDGYDDNGIDAIYFDRTDKILWLVQSKFIEGNSGVKTGDVGNFISGIKKLIDGDFFTFNHKIKDRQEEILEALDDVSVKIKIVLAYTDKDISSHNKEIINNLMKEQNGLDELIFFVDLNLEAIYKGIELGIGDKPIDEDVMLSNWGYIESPFKSFYGQIVASDLGELWKNYGRRLFNKNIRDFLGKSTVNEEISKTIMNDPDKFIYFNNGITILCKEINKKPLGGNDRTIGSFECKGISVVNGAQTLGTIGTLRDNNQNLQNVKVFVRFISLENSGENFEERLTIATNTQNKIERKDFVSLDSEQIRIKNELELESIRYHYKRTDEKIIPDENNFILEEVTFSLACLFENVDYSTMVKKESGRLWEDVNKSPYIDIFNKDISASKIIKAVKIYRYISDLMIKNSLELQGREKSIYRYGNAFISHIILQKIEKKLWNDTTNEFDSFYNNNLPSLTEEYIKKLKDIIEKEYPDSMIVYILRNYTKCRKIKELILQ